MFVSSRFPCFGGNCDDVALLPYPHTILLPLQLVMLGKHEKYSIIRLLHAGMEGFEAVASCVHLQPDMGNPLARKRQPVTGFVWDADVLVRSSSDYLFA